MAEKTRPPKADESHARGDRSEVREEPDPPLNQAQRHDEESPAHQRQRQDSELSVGRVSQVRHQKTRTKVELSKD